MVCVALVQAARKSSPAIFLKDTVGFSTSDGCDLGTARMKAKQQRLYINIDHVATLRQARRGQYPDPVEAALVCERAGADGITAHLREDRRHIQDLDVNRLKKSVTTYFNLEMACVAEMLELARRIKPEQVTLVPERREEVTTEGGLDILSDPSLIQNAIDALSDAGIRVSLFIDPAPAAIDQSKRLGVPAIELHTGTYSLSPDTTSPLEALRDCARRASELGLAVHAGHGLNLQNVGPVAAIPEVEELNIGHSVVARAVFVGLGTAVKEMREAMDAARSS
jgi:pyridoxine 5-phosphate synthase